MLKACFAEVPKHRSSVTKALFRCVMQPPGVYRHADRHMYRHVVRHAFRHYRHVNTHVRYMHREAKLVHRQVRHEYRHAYRYTGNVYRYVYRYARCSRTLYAALMAAVELVFGSHPV